MKNWMKNSLLILILPWLLAGCVLERFALPNDYAPKHPGSTAPLADGAVFKGVADPKKGGEIFLRFVKTGPAQYVAEHFIAMPDGEDIVLPPAHARFVPLGGAHYALYWKRIGEEPKQGYALVRLGAGRLQVLEPMSQSSTLALAKAHGIATQPPGLVGGYTFDTRDEARVLKFFRDLSVRKTEATLTLAATQQIPADLRTRTYAKLGEHVPRLTRVALGSEADAAAVAAWAQRLSREGDGHGHHLLARLSANGWGISADSAVAIREAEAAVNKGVPQAAHVIAAMHYYGIGVPADPARALPYAHSAAEAGSPGAMLLLGFAYGNGRGVTQDHEAAKRWLQRAMDRNYGPAFAQWADLVITEKTEAADRVALPAIERGVAHNDARAHVLRGVFHENGRAGPRDMDAAMKHFLAAAELGDAYAQYLVGHRLRHGQHIAQDIPRGRALLAEAAQAGSADASKAIEADAPEVYLALGIAYRDGDGVAQSLDQARIWLEKSVGAQQWEANAELAKILIKDNSPSSKMRARELIELGIEKNQANAYHLRGTSYASGWWGLIDWKRAYGDTLRAAELGYAPAQKTVGVMLLDGFGTQKNEIEGSYWLRRAADTGDMEAKDMIRARGIPPWAAIPSVAQWSKQRYADEAKDFGVPPRDVPVTSGFHRNTPLRVPGARTVNTNEVMALLKSKPVPIVIDVYGETESLPGSVYLKGFGLYRPVTGRIAKTRAVLDPLVGGDRNRAIIFLCVSVQCWHSYNAALFALEAGYTDVMWYRGGLTSWKFAKQTTAVPRQIAWE